MSANNTITWQQNFGTIIFSINQFDILQQLIMGVAFSGFAAILPSMLFLLYEKWSIFNEGLIEEQRLIQNAEMVKSK